MKDTSYIIGAGGHANSVYAILNYDNRVSDIKFVVLDNKDDDMYVEEQLFFDKKLYLNNSVYLGVGSVGNINAKKNIVNKLHAHNIVINNIVAKSAIYYNLFDISNIEGIFIGNNAFINQNTQIGNMVIVNSGSIIEHDCTIGDYVHVAPHATLCGNVQVGDNTHIGAGSVVKQGVKIGKNCVIGAGSVVVKDIPDNVVAYGNPCKVVKNNG